MSSRRPPDVTSAAVTAATAVTTAAAAVHQAPVHHQAPPSVQDLLNYGVPAVPTQTVPQIIDARDKQKLQSAAKDDRIVFA